MDFTQVKDVSKEIFLSLCLNLFTEYRSAKIKNNGDVVFWYTGKTVFNTQNTISFKNLIIKHIPRQLSYCKWHSYDRQDHYVSMILTILEENEDPNDILSNINKWFVNEFEGLIVTNLSSSVMDEYKIHINELGNIAKIGRKKNKNFKVDIRKDIVNPYIQRIKDFDTRKTMYNVTFALKTLVIAMLMKANITFTPLNVRPNEPTKVNDRKLAFTEQPLFPVSNCKQSITINKQNNTGNIIIFDSS